MSRTMVRTYTHPNEFNRDAGKLAKKGWTVLSTMERSPQRSLLFKLTFGLFTLFLPKRKQIVVTYAQR